MAYISMAPNAADYDVLEAAFYDSFEKTCESAGVCVPWDRSEFKRLARGEGRMLCFLWGSTSYELVNKYPNLKERFQDNLREAVKAMPKLFE